jgi:signal transduction histidine kinase
MDASVPAAVMASGDPERILRLADRVGHGLEALSSNAAAALIVPLGFRGRARGVMVAFDSLAGGPDFAPDQQHLLTSFGASAAIAIATAQSVEAERLRHSVRASEFERTRWARELHDETLQELGALKVGLQAAHATGRAEALQKAVESSLEQLELSIGSLQSLITELRPASLDELGIQPALEALARRTSARFGVAVETHFDLAFPSGRHPTRLTDDVESTAYRLVQEAINNAVKHAGGETISLEVLEDDASVVITVRDDGEGFDPERPSDGFGLLGMRERAELVDGRVLIDSARGRGTTVRAELPALHRPAAGLSDPPSSRPAESG